MSGLRHKLMREEAAKRLAAARTLKESLDVSDSAYLLDLLGFELLLKVTFEVACHKQSPTHHRYDEIFTALPPDTQTQLLRRAADRIHSPDLITRHIDVLKDLGRNFISLRYPYEKYGHMTDAEYQAAGDAWLASGGDIAAADFRYHPEELFALTVALQETLHGC